ncbi:hypothetical protein F5050DRAFT_642841 [Lentinula boryana]|uniref:Uncharacterized protein n=1 Tax=Lentinula boryana TaxID=40481 RepID=A0ABQ8Q5M2_9AGAR|nr:hypothetical protein F5050DRAFT_642841 [Lentinula boryana]
MDISSIRMILRALMVFLGILLCVSSTLAIPLSPPVTRMADNVISTVNQNSVPSKNAVPLQARNFSEIDTLVNVNSSPVSINHDTNEAGVENPTIRLPAGSAESLVTRGSESSKVSSNPKKTKKVVSVTFASTIESRTPWGHKYRSYAVERVKEMLKMQFVGKEIELKLDEESHPGYPTCTFDVKVSEGPRKKTGEQLTGEFKVELNKVDIKNSGVVGGFKKSDGTQTGYPYIYPPLKTKPLSSGRKSHRKKKTGKVLKTVDKSDRRIDTIQEEEE